MTVLDVSILLLSPPPPPAVDSKVVFADEAAGVVEAAEAGLVVVEAVAAEADPALLALDEFLAPRPRGFCNEKMRKLINESL